MSRDERHRREYQRRVNKVIDHISATLGEEHSVESLARVAAFSPFHFHRVFKAVTGENLFELVSRLRLEAAAGALLARRDDDVLAIALDHGFSSASAFARAFKERFGMSATEWRGGGASVWSKARMAESKQRKADGNAGKAAGGGDPYVPGMTHTDDEITIQKLPAMRVAYLRHTGPYGEAGKIPDLWRSLRRWAEARDLWTADRLCLGIAQDDPRVTAPEKCRYDAAIVIGDRAIDESAINVAVVPPGKFATVKFVGTAKEVDAPWDAIFRWLPESGYQPDHRAALEVYRGECIDFRTEVVTCDICLAVKPL